MTTLSCFKAYDVRGRLGDELNEDVTRRIGLAFAKYLSARRVVVGGDSRLSSPGLKAALAEGLREAGADVFDLGLAGTEEMYFAAFSQDFDGGLVVTGSHNPVTDNGIKLVLRGARPISSDNGLLDIRRLAEDDDFVASPDKGTLRGTPRGTLRTASFQAEYVEHILRQVSVDDFPPLRILVNPGHGAAGPVLALLERALAARGAELEFVKIGFEPDGAFPLGIPNPLLPENRSHTSEAVRARRADLGLAWDGDFDRCFFFDHEGSFIEGYYLVGLLAEAFLAKFPGAAIVHDPRLTWNTVEIVERRGGRPVVSRTGHAFLKDRMRAERAVYGGEMSAHHYFADFAYCDSGMLPWLLVLELMGRRRASLASLVAERQALFPCSGEINYRVPDPTAVLAAVEDRWGGEALRIDRLDGLSLETPRWRLNLRASNTEPLLRLNLESRGDPDLVAEKVSEVERVIRSFSVQGGAEE